MDVQAKYWPEQNIIKVVSLWFNFLPDFDILNLFSDCSITTTVEMCS